MGSILDTLYLVIILLTIITSLFKHKSKRSYLDMSKSTDDDTPKKLRLKKALFNLSITNELKSKKIKVLRQKISRQKKKISSLKQVVTVLKKKNLLNEDSVEILMDSFGNF